MLLSQEARQGVEVVTVRGTVGPPDAATLGRAVAEAVAKGPRGVLVDLVEALGVGPAAAEALNDAARQAAGWPRPVLGVVGATSALLDLLLPQVRRLASRAGALEQLDAEPGPETGPSPDHASVRAMLPSGPRGPGEARRLAARWAREHGVDGDDLALVVTELVTNAVRHGEPPIELAIDADDERVTVVVADGGPGLPVPREAGRDEEGGRGLLLVEGLSADRGVRPRPPGKAVWAALPVSPEASVDRAPEASVDRAPEASDGEGTEAGRSSARRVPASRVVLPARPDLPGWEDLRRELDAPGPFPPEVLAEAEAAAAAPRLPELDLTDVAFLTLDPEGSRDLDQAMALERDADGYLVRYAIADVAAFVTPGGVLDAECRRRGETLYLPDVRVPLHPPVLSEGAASLLEDQVRPALVWTFALDGRGEPTSVDVRRARVRSRRRLAYPQVQAALDDGSADEVLVLLREVGLLRQRRGLERGAVDLPSPEQEVEDGPDGRPVLTLRAALPVEGWNAQISLLTGLAAARLMLDGGVGLLRTLPPAEPEAVEALRRSALALGIAWPEGASYGEVVTGLDATVPAQVAVLTLATRLLRGAGYTAFDGAPPGQPLHSGLAAPYAHATAPLRRLADRYAGEVCVALCAGEPVPAWARDALPQLPELMREADRRASALDRAVVDLAEALLLAPRVGEVFDAAVVDASAKGGTVQLLDPPVRAHVEGVGLPLGQRVRVRLVTADPVTRTVLFRPEADPVAGLAGSGG